MLNWSMYCRNSIGLRRNLFHTFSTAIMILFSSAEGIRSLMFFVDLSQASSYLTFSFTTAGTSSNVSAPTRFASCKFLIMRFLPSSTTAMSGWERGLSQPP